MSSDKKIPQSSFPPAPFGIALGIFFLAAGLAGWMYFLWHGETTRAWQALLVNFIFFTPLAGAMVVWPAVVILARGRWTSPALVRSALSGIAFAPVSLAAFFTLWAGASHWAPWMHEKPLAQGFWLEPTFVFVRNAAGLVAFWAVAYAFYRRHLTGRPRGLGAGFVLLYCLVFSLLGFDLVMALDPHWYSSLFGGYFFISGMYIAVAGWSLLSVGQDPRPELLHDLGKLIVAFSLLTTYLMFSQLIPIWYENLPHETRFVTVRMNFADWRTISAVLLGTVYLGPLVWLLSRSWKQRPRRLGAVALAVLIGMWMERWWLVAPTMGGDLRFGAVEVCMTGAFLGAYGLAVAWFYRRVPVERIATEDRHE